MYHIPRKSQRGASPAITRLGYRRSCLAAVTHFVFSWLDPVHPRCAFLTCAAGTITIRTPPRPRPYRLCVVHSTTDPACRGPNCVVLCPDDGRSNGPSPMPRGVSRARGGGAAADVGARGSGAPARLALQHPRSRGPFAAVRRQPVATCRDHRIISVTPAHHTARRCNYPPSLRRSRGPESA